MLWILSGSYHSGKNTLRNLLAMEYGFSVIDKFVKAETAGNTFDYDDKTIAARDPFLVTNNEEADEEISRLENGSCSDMNSSAKFFIFEKTRGQYYLIRKSDIATAIKDDEKNYVLVCSEPNTVQKIRDLKIMKFGGSYFSTAEKNQRIKSILIFGLNLTAEEKRNNEEGIITKATNKFSEYISYMVQNGDAFDFVIYNKYADDPDKILRHEWDKMYIKLAQSLVLGEYRPFSYKLSFDSANPPRYRSGVFFVKPFSNKNSSRPDKVFYVVNQKISEILQSVGNVKITKTFAKQSIDYSMNGASEVEYREGNDEPWSQMRSQIEEANLLIVDVADIDDSNSIMHKPNCYWELGYARALCKNIIVLCDERAGKIEFDEQDKIYIKYSIIVEGDNCRFVPKDAKKNNIGSNDRDVQQEGYSFENEIASFYARLKTAMETSYMNRIILMKAANAWKK